MCINSFCHSLRNYFAIYLTIHLIIHLIIYFAILHNLLCNTSQLCHLLWYSKNPWILIFSPLTKLELPFAFPLSSSHSTLNFFSRYSLTGLTLSFSPLISVPTANFPSFLCFLYDVLFFLLFVYFFNINHY